MTMREFYGRLLTVFGVFALVVLAMFGGASAIFAQDVVVPETVVNFQYGDLLGVFLTNLADNPDSAAWTAFGLALTWLVSRLPGPLKFAYNMFRVEQLLRNAVAGAVNSTAGAVQGKNLNVDVGGEVLAKALQYAIDNGSAGLIKWMGGEVGVQQKLIARIPTNEAVDGDKLVAKADAVATATVDGSAPGSVT